MTPEEKKQRQREYNKQYHLQHREEILARKKAKAEENKGKPKKEKTPEQLEAYRRYQREWRRRFRMTEKGKASQAESDRRYLEKNKEKVKARRKELHQANKEKRNAACRADYAKKAEDRKKHKREYNKANRDRVRLAEKAIEHKRRAARGDLRSEQIGNLLEESMNICAYCNNQFEEANMHIEHCMPLSRGGTNSLDNVVIACETCNKRKKDKTPLEFMLNWPKVTARYDFFVDD